SFAMPVIDLCRPGRTKCAACCCGTNRIVANLGQRLRMRCDARAKLLREHLRAQANAEQRPLLAQRNFDPVDFAPDVIIRIIGAHRTAEDDGAGMLVECIWERIAEARTADVEAMAERAQRVADAA